MYFLACAPKSSAKLLPCRGPQSQANSAAGRQACEAYSNHQRYNTVAHAILPALQMLAQEQEAERAAGGGAGTSAGQSRACPLAGEQHSNTQHAARLSGTIRNPEQCIPHLVSRSVACK